jgi:hypothetical protein
LTVLAVAPMYKETFIYYTEIESLSSHRSNLPSRAFCVKVKGTVIYHH